MALILGDRVKETTTVIGTGTATLLGATTGFQSFSVVGNGNTTYYCIADQGGPNWEVGIGTYTSAGTTLARTTVLASSNAGGLVSFTSGVKDVFVTYPAEKGVWLDASNNAIGLGTPAAFVGTNITGTASGLTAGNVITNANLTGAITSLGNATSLGSFTSLQLATALTDETGSGSAVFATSPTLANPTYTGTLTGSTGILNIGSGQLYKDASGNVGIGTSSPASYGSPLTVYLAANPTLTIASENANAYLRLNTTSDSNMYLTNTGGSMTMNTANTERMRIDSLGNVTLQENISVGGAAPTTVGNGITFPATQAASSNANTLDDYEEGTWTPVLSFATNGTMTYTASTANGYYTKIGNVVTCRVALNLSAFTAGTASGIARISLPFTSALTYFTATVFGATFTTLFPNLALTVGSASYVQLYGNSAINTTPISITPTHFQATSQVYFSITYTV